MMDASGKAVMYPTKEVTRAVVQVVPLIFSLLQVATQAVMMMIAFITFKSSLPLSHDSKKK